MSSGIPCDINFNNISCQLGGLTLNGNVNNGTASNLSILTINDPTVIQVFKVSDMDNVGCIKINIGNINSTGNGDFTKSFYLPIYQIK